MLTRGRRPRELTRWLSELILSLRSASAPRVTAGARDRQVESGFYGLRESNDNDATEPEPENPLSKPAATTLMIGDHFICVDKKGICCEAKVIDEDGSAVHVHYVGFKQSCDEWIERTSDRLNIFLSSCEPSGYT